MTAAILETGIAPNMTAGLSLGEYAAIATAGAMDIKTALLLVRKRGLLMQNATKDGFGGMAAVLGLEPDVLEALLKNTDAVTVANYNCPGQQVITGETQALLEMCQTEGKRCQSHPFEGQRTLPFSVYEAGRRKTGTGAGTGETVRASDSVCIKCIGSANHKNRADLVPAFPGGLFSGKVGAEHEDDASRR